MCGLQARAQLVRGRGLAQRADVVALAFHRQQRRLADGLEIDRLALERQLALGQPRFLEHPAHGLEIELGRQIEHGEIFVVEALDDLRLLDLAVGEVLVELLVRVVVPVDVHRHEGDELHEARDRPRRRAPRYLRGTRAMRLRSNQLIGLLVASLLTLVGLMRVSIGPAISVMLLGCAGLPSAAITATAASACTQGWQTATRCAPGPSSSRKRMR